MLNSDDEFVAYLHALQDPAEREVLDALQDFLEEAGRLDPRLSFCDMFDVDALLAILRRYKQAQPTPHRQTSAPAARD